MDHCFEARVRRLVAATVANDGVDAGFRQAQRHFSWLSGRGVAVDVHRDCGQRANQGARPAATMALEPDILLAGQLGVGRSLGTTRSTGERRLMVAVLGDAVGCYRRGLRARDPATRLLFAETRAWLESTDHGAIFSFESICDALGIDADYLRRGLRRRRVPGAGGNRP